MTAMQAMHRPMPYVISASAGTGKTTRLLQDVLLDLLERDGRDDSVSIRESLIITFTVAAAAEIRRRLEHNLRYAINYAGANEGCPPDDPAMRDDGFVLGGDSGDLARAIRRDCRRARVVFTKALRELPTVQISTIDALAKTIVDRNADVLDAPVGFVILADEAEKRNLRRGVMDDLFEYWYDPADSLHGTFADVLDNVGGPRNDGTLRDIMLGLYDRALTKPDRLDWLDELSVMYRGRVSDAPRMMGADAFIDAWFGDWLDGNGAFFDDLNNCLSRVAERCGGESAAATSARFRALRAIAGLPDRVRTEPWNAVRAAVKDPSLLADLPGRIMVGKTAILKDAPVAIPADDNLGRHLAELTKGAKERVKELRDRLAFTAEQMDALNGVGERRLDGLVRLIRAFDGAYGEEKRRLGVAEFADVSYWAVTALKNPQVASGIGRRWRYVYVDECQDNNALQNRFIRAIGADAAKLTMVGDVKQSIYGFRDASPEEFGAICAAVDDPSHRRELWVNHRSTPEIITFVNTVFSRLMTPRLGAVDYRAEQLRIDPSEAGDGEPYDTHAVELLIGDADITLPDEQAVTCRQNGGHVRSGKDEMQTDMIVRRIRELCEGDDAEYRYGDVAVIARGASIFADLHDQLAAAGIPSEVAGVGAWYSRSETRIALDWLRIIVDPHRDIPLVAVLRTYGFDDDDLARIRLASRGAIYDAMRSLAGQDGRPEETAPPQRDLARRIRTFLDLLDDLRRFAVTHSARELICRMLEVTGLYDFVGSLPEGVQRQANLRQLSEKAGDAERTWGRSIEDFLEAVDAWSMQGGGEEASTVSTDDAVHIMTIHKAKGLQWPVVILMGAGNQLLSQSGSGLLTVDGRPLRGEDGTIRERAMGAWRLRDSSCHVVFDTFQQQLVRRRNRERDAAEELRLLYVALTRPRRKLIVAGMCRPGKDAAGLDMADLGAGMRADGSVASASSMIDVGKGPSYLYWIVGALTTFGGTKPLTVGLSVSAVWRMRSNGCEPESGMDGDGRGITVRFDCSSPRTVMPEVTDIGADVPRINLMALQPLPREGMCIPATVSSSKVGYGTVSESSAMSDALATEALDGERTGWTEAPEPVVFPEHDDEDDADIGGIGGVGGVGVGTVGTRPGRGNKLRLPEFLTGSRVRPTPARVGTAVHAVLELFDWDCPPTTEACVPQIREIVADLRHNGIVSDAAARRVLDRDTMEGLLWFVGATELEADGDGGTGGICALAGYIRAHRRSLFREVPFSMLVDVENPASAGNVEAVFPGRSVDGDVGENGCDIVVRGIIDGYVVDETTRTIMLFDYKTDAVRSGESVDEWERRLRREYQGQQALYAEALRRRYPGYDVTGRWLVGLAAKRLIDVREDDQW